MIAAHGRMSWQKTCGYNTRAKVEASIGRYKQVIGDGLRFRRDNSRMTEVAVAVTSNEPHAEAGMGEIRSYQVNGYPESLGIRKNLLPNGRPQILPPG